YVGVNKAAVHYWENGEDFPHIQSVPKILEFLGYDPFPESTTFAEALRHFRMKNGLTQESLARLLGVRSEAVSTWESGRCQPSAVNLSRIERLLEQSTHDITSSGQNQ